MIAPVVGSGAWPAWMPRVAKPRRLLCFWAMRRVPCASAHAAAQMVDEVDAGDEADEPAVLLEHGDMVLGEDRQQGGERRTGSAKAVGSALVATSRSDSSMMPTSRSSSSTGSCDTS